MQHQLKARCDSLTGVGQTPAVCVFSQQAAECVSVFVEIDITGTDAHHLFRKTEKLLLRDFCHYFPPYVNIQRCGAVGGYHVSSIHWRCHLDFPEVLPFSQLLGATDGCCAAAVLRVEAHFAIVAAEQRGRRSAVGVPNPVKLWKNHES